MIYYLTDNSLKTPSAVLRVQGPDANTYLQGQFTQDLKGTERGAIYGLWLDQKGKVLADSHILRLAENDFLVFNFGAPEGLLRTRLEAYLIADEVELKDVTREWSVVLAWGEKFPALALPAEAYQFPSRRAGPDAREIALPIGRHSELVATLKEFAIAGTPAAAELARLRAAIPAVPADIGPKDLPAEGALDDVAISFTKGCYLGQEVIARLKNLGQVRRALHVVTGAGEPPGSGSPLFHGERKLGEIRSAAADGEIFLAMAMLSLVNLDPAQTLSLAPGGNEVTIVRRV